MVIESLSLPEFAGEKEPSRRSGSRFLTAILERYRRANAALDRQCREDPTSSADCVHVASTEHFSGIDPTQISKCYQHCLNGILTTRTRRRCREVAQQMLQGATPVSIFEVPVSIQYRYCLLSTEFSYVRLFLFCRVPKGLRFIIIWDWAAIRLNREAAVAEVM